jgi:Domain of unknown function (DUF4388)
MAMRNLSAGANILATLVDQTRGVVGVVLGTTGAELRAVAGSVADGDVAVAVAASLTGELGAIGALLALGPLGVASLKAATAARVFARQDGAVVAIELDPKCPLGELEVKLRTLAWAPQDEQLEPMVHRVATRPRNERTGGTTLPPPFPSSVLAQANAAGSGPVFTGDLEEFKLPDLLELLRNTHRSGLLMCTTRAGVGTIQLSRGFIIGAHSPNALDLRQHFLTSPEVTPDRRRALAALPAECFDDHEIEDVLVSRELVPRDEVERARVARIYSAFREMMRWTVGRFSFDPGVAVVTAPALALSAQSILMHIYQEQDEQAR